MTRLTNALRRVPRHLLRSGGSAAIRRLHEQAREKGTVDANDVAALLDDLSEAAADADRKLRRWRAYSHGLVR
jgi:hypothetical protein